MSIQTTDPDTEMLPPELRQSLEVVEEINSELDAVMAKAAEFSEKTREVSDAFKGLSKAIGGGTMVAANLAADQRGFKAGAKTAGAGAVAAGAAAAISWGVDKIGGMYEEYKRKKERERLLKKKRSIAQKKVEFVEKAIPRLEKNLTRIDRMLRSDASRTFSYRQWDRYDAMCEQIHSIFMGRYEAKIGLAKAKFLRDEFQAWLRGSWESDGRVPIGENEFRKAVVELVQWSDLDEPENYYDVSDYISVGGVYLLRRSEVSDHAIEIPEFERFAKTLAKAGARSKFLRLGAQRKYFREFYNDYLASAGELGSRVTVRVFGYIVLALGVILGSIWFGLGYTW